MKGEEKLKMFDPDGLESDNTFQFIPVEDEPKFNLLGRALELYTQSCYFVGCLFIGLYLGKLLVYFSGVANVDFNPW